MNLITILHKLLDRAYTRAIAKAYRKADRALAEATAAGDESVELAAKAQIALEESQAHTKAANDYVVQAHTIERQRSRAADLFGGI